MWKKNCNLWKLIGENKLTDKFVEYSCNEEVLINVYN